MTDKKLTHVKRIQKAVVTNCAATCPSSGRHRKVRDQNFDEFGVPKRWLKVAAVWQTLDNIKQPLII